MKQERIYRLPLARYPGVRLALLLASGIAIESVIEAGYLIIMILFGFIVLVYTILEHSDPEKNVCRISVGKKTAYLLLIPVTGMLLISLQKEKIKKKQFTVEHMLLFAWDEVAVEGEVVNVFQSSSGRYNKDLKVNRTIIDGRIWNYTYLIRLYGDQDEPGAGRGDKVRATVRIYELEHPVNPGQFDYKLFLNRQQIFVHGDFSRLSVLGSAGSTEPFLKQMWHELRTHVHSRIEDLFGEDTRPLAKALLTGYKQELDRESRQYFARAGLSHIMAVSGLHVGFIVAPFWLLIPWIWQFRFGTAAGLIVITLMLLIYAGLTGFSASVSRASLMAFLLCTGKLMRRDRESLNLMGVSAVILLLIDPGQLFDIGFQLSYGAVTVILILLPVVQKALPADVRYSRSGKLLMVILVSVVVQIGLFPVLVWYFGEFSIIGPIANALVVPVLSAIVPLSFLLIVTTDLFPTVTALLNIPNQYALQWIGYIAEKFGGWHGSWIAFELDTPLVFGLWFAVIGFFATITSPVLRVRFLALKLVLLKILLIQSFIQALSPAKMKVTLLDVGQGDAIHIVTPHDRHLLIDTGRWSPSGNSGERVLMPYFEAMGIRELDAVILTHPHADHIGGMPALIRNMEIQKIYHCGYEYDSALYRRYRRLASAFGIETEQVKKGDMIDTDPSIRIFVVGPDGNIHNSNPNDHSVSVLIVYNRMRFLFTGDAERSQERRMAGIYGDFLEADFYKMGHHGSRTSTNDVLLKYVQPRKAAGSLSFRNRFHHPHPEAVSRIYRYTDRVYFTSLEGALVFESDGYNIRIK